MRNLKKLLAVVLAICVIATFTAPAFAADAAAAPADSKICSDLGVLQGDGNGVTAAYLAKGTTRLQAAILQLRLLGKEDEALAETSTENFADAKDLAWAEGRNVLAYLKKNPSLGWVGDGTNFKPNEITTTQMIYKVMLVSLGFEEGAGKDFQYADTITFAAGKGLTKIATKTTLTNDDTATALVEALKANIKDGTKTLAADLVAKNIITAAAADATGLVLLYKPAALDVSSAVALNSKTVELSLGTAAVAADVAAATITVKDAAGAAIAVTGAALAPWSTDGKSVLVTLEANTVAGTLYTMTVGAKTANFGGKAADTTAPTVTKVESTDYNQITVTFSEPILLGGAVTAALKYTPKTALATSAIAYASSSSITVATDPQAASLYGVTVNGFKDLAGTAMTEDTAKTFIGQVKSTTVPAIASIKAEDSKTVRVTFNEKMDATTSIDIAKYTAGLNYTPKTAIAVASAVKDADDAKTVILTLATDTTAALYQVTVAAGVTSKYGVASTAASTLTFVGEAADTTKLGTPTVANVSNTKITLDFGDPVKDKVDPATTKDAFAIKLKYTPFTVLEISSISIDKEVVTITTAAQATSLYEVTVKSGIKDAKGNATTADIATTFVGQAVKAKITAVSSVVNGDSGTTLTLTFDQNVGAGAFDVANYSISGGIGYPTKAEAVADAPAKVKLTIPATTLGTNYTITVKNVSNSDGIAMDAAGITKTFIGAGAAAGKAQMVAVQTLDEQTIKVYFDRDVTDAKIATIWDSTAKNIKAGILTIDAAADLALIPANTYAYQDAVDKTALVIRVVSAGNDLFNATKKDTTVGAFKLIASTDAGLNADNDELVFVPSETAMAAIGVVNVQAIDKETLKVYFDQPTYIDHPDFATVTSKVIIGGGDGIVLNISSVVAVAGTNNMEYLLKLDGAMVKENKDYTLKVSDNKDVLKAKINDTSVDSGVALDFVTLADEDGTDGNPIVINRIFAPVFTAAADITDIAVQMTDAKTIVVYYPQIMNATGTAPVGSNGTPSASVIDPDNYVIMNGAAVPDEVTMANGMAFTAADIGNITYDAATNTAKIVLKQTIKTFDGGAFLYFQNTATKIANATGTAFVKNDTAQVTKQFAVSTAAAAEVGISSVTVSTTAGTTTVKIVLDQKSTVAGTVYLNATNFLTNFSITKQVYGEDKTLLAGDIVAGPITFATDDTFTVTLTTAIPANTGVIVKGIKTSTDIVGKYNGEGLNDASEVIVAAQ